MTNEVKEQKEVEEIEHFLMLDLITLVINLYPNIIVRRLSDLNDVVEIEDEDSNLDIMIKVFDKGYRNLMNK